jgi:hypothetical protein
MLAVAATAVFLLFFEQIILVAGLLTIASPVAAALYWNSKRSVWPSKSSAQSLTPSLHRTRYEHGRWLDSEQRRRQRHHE